MTTIHLRTALVATMLGVLVTASETSAQVFGTFPWQMPYCNVVTLTLTTIPAGFTLDGSDNQCGASIKGSDAAGGQGRAGVGHRQSRQRSRGLDGQRWQQRSSDSTAFAVVEPTSSPTMIITGLQRRGGARSWRQYRPRQAAAPWRSTAASPP